jgi:hypothetical protein
MNFQTEYTTVDNSDEYRYVPGLGYIKLDDLRELRDR